MEQNCQVCSTGPWSGAAAISREQPDQHQVLTAVTNAHSGRSIGIYTDVAWPGPPQAPYRWTQFSPHSGERPMDPASAIVTALALGATAALNATVGQVVKDAYESLS